MLKAEIKARLCSEELLEIREYHISRLQNLYDGKEVHIPFVLKGILGNSSVDAYVTPELWVDEAIESLA